MKKQRFWLYLMILYCLLMLWLMLIRGRGNSSDAPYWQQVREHLLLQPFGTISDFWDILVHRTYYMDKFGDGYGLQVRHAVVNLLGNVVMFVPLGLLLPMCFRKLQHWYTALGVAAAVIVTVELLQLLTLRGTCDVDDLILNLPGVMVGYGLWRLFGKS